MSRRCQLLPFCVPATLRAGFASGQLAAPRLRRRVASFLLLPLYRTRAARFSRETRAARECVECRWGRVHLACRGVTGGVGGGGDRGRQWATAGCPIAMAPWRWMPPSWTAALGPRRAALIQGAIASEQSARFQTRSGRVGRSATSACLRVCVRARLRVSLAAERRAHRLPAPGRKRCQLTGVRVAHATPLALLPAPRLALH